jgi:hypothetical protein
MVHHKFHGTAFLSERARLTYPIAECNSERLQNAIRLAKTLGIDAGVTAKRLSESGSEGLKSNFLFCVRILHHHSTLVPHRTKLPTQYLDATASLTSSKLSQICLELSDRTQTLQKWSAAVTNILNYAGLVSGGLVSLDRGNATSISLLNASPIDYPSIRDQLVPAAMRFSKIDPLSPRGNSASVEMEEPIKFLISEMNDVFTKHAATLRLAQLFYASLSALDTPDLVIDTPTWFRIVDDTKLISSKIVTKAVSDAVFRSLAGPPQAIAAAIVSLQPVNLSQTQPGLLSTRKAEVLQRGELEDEGISSNYKMNVAKLPVAIARIFLGRGLCNPPASAIWTDVDRGVEQFREFFESMILPNLQQSLVDQWIENYESGAVQDVLRSNKENLRKIFSELAERDQFTMLNRIRMDAFVGFFTKELRMMTDVSEAQGLYQTSRIASGILSPLRGVAQVAGLDLTGFCIALMALSRIKYGFSLISHAQALSQYLNTILMPMCQYRMKVKLEKPTS